MSPGCSTAQCRDAARQFAAYYTSDRVFDAAGALDDGVVLGRLDLLADQVVGFARATASPELHAVAL